MKKLFATKQRLFTSIATGLLLTSIVSCTERFSFQYFGSRDGKNPPSSNDCNSTGGCTDSFNQQGTLVTDKAAVIFSVDISGSMIDDKDPIAAAAGKLAEALATEGFEKLCFGAMAGHADPSISGKLQASAAGEYCVCADQVPAAELPARILAIFSTFNYAGSGPVENPDLAAQNFLSNPDVIQFNANASGGRCGGGLNTGVFMISTSDEESQRAAKDNATVNFSRDGTTLYPDPSETIVRRDFMSKLNANTNQYDDIFSTATLMSAYNGYCGTLPCDYSFIGYKSNSGVPAPQEVNTFGQADVAASGGEYIDILLARNNPTAFVQTFVDQLKPKLAAKLNYSEIFDTKFDICDSKPFSVKADGVDVTQFSSKVGANRVRVTAPNNVASVIEIKYVQAGSFDCN